MNASCYYSIITIVFTGITITVTIVVEKSNFTCLLLGSSWKSKSKLEAGSLGPRSRRIRKKTMEGVSHKFTPL